MPYLVTNNAARSYSRSNDLRAQLGITQSELGDLLGVSAAQVGHVEAGRRGYSAKARYRLERLCDLLRALPPEPAAPPVADPAPAAGPLPDEAAALRKRLRTCRHLLLQLRYQQTAPERRAAMLRRRQQALSALQAAVAAQAAPPPGDLEANPAREQEWLELLALASRRAGFQQPTPTEQAWQALRQQLLEAEIAGLQVLLGEAPAS